MEQLWNNDKIWEGLSFSGFILIRRKRYSHFGLRMILQSGVQEGWRDTQSAHCTA